MRTSADNGEECTSGPFASECTRISIVPKSCFTDSTASYNIEPIAQLLDHVIFLLWYNSAAYKIIPSSCIQYIVFLTPKMEVSFDLFKIQLEIAHAKGRTEWSNIDR